VDLLVVALIDWEHMIIPHTLTVSGIAVGLALAPWNGLGLGPALLGGAAGAGIILLLAYGYRLFRGQIGMGGGDVMLMGMVGAFLGVRGVLVVLFGGALMGCLFVLIRFRAAVSGQSRLPFGTFLAAAAALALLAGDRILDWYWRLMA
jgi:leader peptidase (prepilin peptidase)/N-methyltransferase